MVKSRLLLLICLLSILLSLSTISTSKAATLIIEDGTNFLLGATDVLVNGSSYNVSFIDQSCVSAFNGCNNISDFVFQTEPEANMASQALLDQVLTGIYDDAPTATKGLNNINWGAIATPYGLDSGNVLVSYAFNAPAVSPFDDDVFTGSRSITDDLGGQVFYVYADWQNPVPIPGAVWLLGPGLVGLLGIRKKFKK